MGRRSRAELVRVAIALAASWVPLAGCGRRAPNGDVAEATTTLVFRAQPMWGDPAVLHQQIANFERAHKGVHVRLETLPNASEIARQVLLTALLAKATDFDVFVADVVWVPEFARAGLLQDLSDAFPPTTLRREFVRGAAEAVIASDKTYAVPWYVDVGILYYRTDLVPRAPETYDELVTFARAAQRAHPNLYGYVWQGRQYEGLVCNAFEAIWGHGGETMRDGRVEVDGPPAREALGYMRSLIASGVSPSSVASAGEEESRRVFQEGRAVFMRNWPYAWNELQKDGSVVRGKVGVATLPSERTSSDAPREPGAGALGGFQLALNAYAPATKRAAALALIAELTSLRSNVALAVAYARAPARTAAYHDPHLVAEAPFIAGLVDAATHARPRPVTPYYGMMSDVLQGEFSAIVSGVRPPDAALARAQAAIDRIEP